MHSTSSLGRGYVVIEELANFGTRGASPTDLLARLAIPRASLFRILRELLELGLVDQDPYNGRYGLGNRLLALGHKTRMTSPLVQAVRPLLQEIVQRTHQMGELAVAVGPWELLMVEVWQVEGTPLGLSSRAGLLFHLRHLNAPGLCYLSFEQERRLSTYLKKARTMAGRRELSIGRAPTVHLAAECERWRRLGYTYRKQHGVDGINARLCVPVFTQHLSQPRLLGTLGLAGDAGQMGAGRVPGWATLLKKQARRLEEALSAR